MSRTIEGNGFTITTPEKVGKIEVKKVSQLICGDTTVLTITPADEFFERAFGHKPKLKEKIQVQIVCSTSYAEFITKGIGIPLTAEDSIVSTT